eukprot:6728214-Prymnesium_polylepis.1
MKPKMLTVARIGQASTAQHDQEQPRRCEVTCPLEATREVSCAQGMHTNVESRLATKASLKADDGVGAVSGWRVQFLLQMKTVAQLPLIRQRKRGREVELGFAVRSFRDEFERSNPLVRLFRHDTQLDELRIKRERLQMVPLHEGAFRSQDQMKVLLPHLRHFSLREDDAETVQEFYRVQEPHCAGSRMSILGLLVVKVGHQIIVRLAIPYRELHEHLCEVDLANLLHGHDVYEICAQHLKFDRLPTRC